MIFGGEIRYVDTENDPDNNSLDWF